MTKLLPILSGSLAEIINGIFIKTKDPIADEIMKAHRAVENANRFMSFVDESFTNDIIEKIIEPMITDEVRMISVRIGEFEVSFLPKSKDPEYGFNGTWSRKNRQTGKPARIFQKLLKREFKTREWEVFTNLFKAELCQCSEFTLVEGEDIRYWYHEDNYYRCDGTLGNSCMRYSEAQSYFNMYVDNAKMLITKKDGLLTGRALVWKVGDITLLDRIYTCFDYLENCFIDYAKSQGWWIRESNSLLSTGEEQGWLTPEDNYEFANYTSFELHFDKEYDLFPYVDSFRYYDGHKTVCTCPKFNYALDCTDGSYSGEAYECAGCGMVSYGYHDDGPSDLYYSEYNDAYYCSNCCWYSDGLEDYVSNNDACVYVKDLYGATYTYPESWVQNNFVENPTGDESDVDICMIDGEYYFCNSKLKFNKETRQYEIRSNSD